MIHDHIQDFQQFRDQTLQVSFCHVQDARIRKVLLQTPCLDDWLEISHGYLLKVQVHSVDLFLSCDQTYKFKAIIQSRLAQKTHTFYGRPSEPYLHLYHGQSLPLETRTKIPIIITHKVYVYL